jgi:hypothetical protein
MQIQFSEKNVGFLTMKWFEKTAQGFSPGECPLAKRPERIRNAAAAGRNSDKAQNSCTPHSNTPLARIRGRSAL